MIEHASLIAIVLAGMALMGLIYVALFMRASDDKSPRRNPCDVERNKDNPIPQPEPYGRVGKRWEDRL